LFSRQFDINSSYKIGDEVRAWTAQSYGWFVWSAARPLEDASILSRRPFFVAVLTVPHPTKAILETRTIAGVIEGDLLPPPNAKAPDLYVVREVLGAHRGQDFYFNAQALKRYGFQRFYLKENDGP